MTKEHKMNAVKKWVASVALASTVVGGGLTVAAIGLPSLAGAQGATATAEKQAQPVKGVIDGLVADGTLTQTQADKIEAALRARGGKPGEKMRPQIIQRGKDVFATVAEVLGITPEQLKTELKAGKSLAQVAQAHGMSAEQLVTALTAKTKVRVDEAVASGKITAEQGQKILDAASKRLPEMIQRIPGSEPQGQRPPK